MAIAFSVENTANAFAQSSGGHEDDGYKFSKIFAIGFIYGSYSYMVHIWPYTVHIWPYTVHIRSIYGPYHKIVA